MDFIFYEQKDYLKQMFQFNWKWVCLVMAAAAVAFFLVYVVTGWRHVAFSGFLLCILIGIYMGCVAGLTLFNREPTGTARMNLDLFWSYRAVLETHSSKRLVEIICNIAMCVPFGIMIPLLLRWTRNFFVFLLCDVAFTVFIESVQYITTRGLFELDDIFNNALGGIIGYLVFYLCYKLAEGIRDMMAEIFRPA